MDKDEAIQRLSAISAPSRLEILHLLANDAGDEGVKSGDIVKGVRGVQNTVSSQLWMLAAAHLVKSRRQGRNIFYKADLEAIAELVDFLLEEAAAGRLGKLERTPAKRS